ncbi:MAG: Shikimate dehydrogenase [Bacteroidota bacterium]
MKKFGLVGKNIDYSFSRKYFSEKFKNDNLNNYEYVNFDIPDIFEFSKVIKTENIVGLNVTIPYKQAVIPFLDAVSKKAKKIGAVNTITVDKNGKTKGYNTDWYGFKKSIAQNIRPDHKKALILGTGGSSKAVAFALKKLKIEVTFVSRTKTRKGFQYADLSQKILSEYQIIINCTPLGTSPNVDICPEIPYEFLTKDQLVFDLIYNPEKTLFLQKSEQQGATIQNGKEMLVFQAEKAWEIWNS